VDSGAVVVSVAVVELISMARSEISFWLLDNLWGAGANYASLLWALVEFEAGWPPV